MNMEKEILKAEIPNRKNQSDELLIDEYYMDKLENERARLKMVRKSIWTLNKIGYLKNSFSDSSKKIVINYQNEEKKDVSRWGKTNPSLFISMILFGIAAILFLGSWIQINGFEVNLLSCADIIDRFDSYFGNYVNLDNIKGAIAFLLVMQTSIVFCYVYLMYRMFRSTESRYAYITLLLMVAVIVCVFIITGTINSEVNRELGFDIINIQVTNHIWLTFIIMCIACAVYVKQKEINQHLFNMETFNKIDEIFTLPINNYYPWEEIRFIDIVLYKNSSTSVYLKYNLPSVWRLRGLKEKWSTPINIVVDIEFTVSERKYVISDCRFTVKWDNPEGRTEKIFLDDMPFQTGDIDGVSVIIKSIKMPDENAKTVRDIFAVSDMNSRDLKVYRKKVDDPSAICQIKVVDDTEWICRCGFVQDISQSICSNCGAYLNRYH